MPVRLARAAPDERRRRVRLLRTKAGRPPNYWMNLDRLRLIVIALNVLEVTSRFLRAGFIVDYWTSALVVLVGRRIGFVYLKTD